MRVCASKGGKRKASAEKQWLPRRRASLNGLRRAPACWVSPPTGEVIHSPIVLSDPQLNFSTLAWETSFLRGIFSVHTQSGTSLVTQTSSRRFCRKLLSCKPVFQQDKGSAGVPGGPFKDNWNFSIYCLRMKSKLLRDLIFPWASLHLSSIHPVILNYTFHLLQHW